MNKEENNMGNGNIRNRLDWGWIIKITIIAITLIIIMAMMKSCIEQDSKNSIEKQKYMIPLEKCIMACDSATTDGSVLERDCINQCFEKEV